MNLAWIFFPYYTFLKRMSIRKAGGCRDKSRQLESL